MGICFKGNYSCDGFENSEIFARSIEITENQQQQPEPTDFTVHFKKPSDWEGAYIHYWQNPKSPITEWFNGGAAMTSESNDWYKFTFNESDLVSGKISFLFKDKKGAPSQQTADFVARSKSDDSCIY